MCPGSQLRQPIPKEEADIVSRLRTLFSNRELVVESIDLNETAQEVVA